MEKIIYKHEMTPYSSRLLDRYFGGMKLGVFDIETLGLNPAQSEMVLAGFLEVSADGSAVVTQYFAQTQEDEPQLLNAVLEEFSRYDYILTYNGKHFDLPFVMKRAELSGIHGIQPGCHNLDLYLVLHGHSGLKQIIKSLKQKNVEDYMGLHVNRKDEISGAESIELYEAYEAEENPAQKEVLKQKVLLHNHDDLLQLYRILPVMQQTDIHRAMSYLGFPVAGACGWPQLNMGRIRLDFKGLTISGTYGISCGETGFSYLSYDSGTAPYSCQFTPEGQFEFLIQTDRHKGSHYLKLDRFFEEDTLLARYPGYVNGHLILSEGNRISYLEVNMFVQEFLKQFMESVPCPR